MENTNHLPRLFILRYILLMLLLFASCFCFSQPGKQVKYKVTTDTLSKSITISFKTVVAINNLVIIIQNEAGQTIFLENQYKFDGSYSRVVPVLTKGLFYLQIINDDIKFKKELTVQ